MKIRCDNKFLIGGFCAFLFCFALPFCFVLLGVCLSHVLSPRYNTPNRQIRRGVYLVSEFQCRVSRLKCRRCRVGGPSAKESCMHHGKPSSREKEEATAGDAPVQSHLQRPASSRQGRLLTAHPATGA